MKKLTVLLATLFVFLSGNAQQILAGIYSGSMYNDSTKMLQKYELALSEYRGKVFGYSYVTFVVNDTFYYGIRRVKGYKNDNNELILTDEELLANNFPESPAKRVKRTATFKLAQEDTITNLAGTWQTNRTRQYYSVGGATKTERTVDSSQSPLVAHLQELKIIAGGPNYQEEAVVKTKPKKEDKKKDTEVAKRNNRKESEPVAGKAPAEKNGNPAEHKETTVDKDAVAATDHKPADKTLAGNKTAQTDTKSSPLPPADRTAASRKDSDAVARANKPDAGPTGTTDKGAVAANNQTHQPDASNTQLPGNKNAAATTDPARVAGSNPDKSVAAATGAENNSTGVKPEGGNKAVAGNPASAQRNAEPGNNQAVALTGDASKTITGPSRNTTNPAASADNATETKPSAAGVKPPAAPAAGKPTAQNAVQTTAGKPALAAGRPAANGNTADGTKDIATAADGKPLENKATGATKEVTVKTPASDSRSGNKDNGNKTSPASIAQKPGQNSTAVVAAGADIKKQTEGDKTTPDKVAAPKNDNIAAAGNPASTAAGSDTKVATGPTAAARDAAPANTTGVNEKSVAATTPDSRTSAVIKTLEVVNDSITLSFYDNGVVDGDVISVYVNGQNIVANARLNEVALKKTIHLANFAGDTVEVTLVAETLGSIPPNTGLLLVYDGDKRYDVRFSADMKTNASIVFRKGKK